MTVHVLIPVHNRLADTQGVIECLRKQSYPSVQIVIIDDGSTDGTSAYLAQQVDVLTLHGNGKLWWAGAIALGLDHISKQARQDDFVLFLNNDTSFHPNYIETLVAVSQREGGAIVGSVLRNCEPPHEVLSLGPVIDIWGMRVWDKFSKLDADEQIQLKPVYPMQAVSGRGSLYPFGVLREIGGMRPRLLPHYYADYEVAMRAGRHGIPVVVSTEATILTRNEFSVERKSFTFFERYFSERSYRNIFRALLFWMMVGNMLQRITVIPRRIFHAVSRLVQSLLRGCLTRLRTYRERMNAVRYCQALRRVLRRQNNDLKLIVGASATTMPGWISTEYPYVDISSKTNLASWFRPGSVSAIVAEHVWEHLTPAQATAACENCFELLKPGGYVRLAVPDGHHPDSEYIAYVKPGGVGAGSEDHKVLYTVESFTAMLSGAGFIVTPQEWFDADGKFHANDWNVRDGMITRSTRFDERNKEDPTAYTSLIVDAKKPDKRSANVSHDVK